ncbi:aldose 1-epimerase [Phyllobacterium sp. YR531]|uniref:aldose 1-epimerase n=1 Tax=Phyllobacterium sp. YR531 TaxID=1144343 RepID=UPI00026FB289|nr:aldose 1-epimerase [Phyllobacterium sp. YR531]EJN02300.1 galactose mutarotase-like enzyme [Phyllobacterium sp. YR531]
MLRLCNEVLDVEISLNGGGVTRANYRGKPFLYPTPVACFPFVPFGNRVAENQFYFQERRYGFTANTATDTLYLHGDGWQGAWVPVRQTETSIVLTYEQGSSPQTPYRYLAEQTISIDRNILSLSLKIENKGEFALPFGLGFHPFFPRTPKTLLRAFAQTFWSETTGHLPDKPGAVPADLDFDILKTLPDRWINNAFAEWDGIARIIWPELQMRAELAADRIFSHYMIYAPQREADFFCFEPMTHLPNGHNMSDLGGMTVLQPGQQMAGSFQIQIEETRR